MQKITLSQFFLLILFASNFTHQFQSFNILSPTFSNLQVHKLAMKFSKFSQDKIKEEINHKSFYPSSRMRFFISIHKAWSS